jgi:hypothetical protein
MRRTTVTVENFYADPEAVAAYALSQEYYYPYQPADRVAAGLDRPSWFTTRFRRAADCPFKGSRKLIAALERAIGEHIDLQHWNGDFPLLSDGRPAPDRLATASTTLWNCSFHVKPANRQMPGEGVHNHVVDVWNSVGEHGWSGLIYLNPDAPRRGGLMTWQNRDPNKQLDWMTPSENWEMMDDFGNLFNRLILTRGNIPHSGAAGWGSDPRDGRLYQTFFFKTLTGSTAPVMDGLTVDLN